MSEITDLLHRLNVLLDRQGFGQDYVVLESVRLRDQDTYYFPFVLDAERELISSFVVELVGGTYNDSSFVNLQVYCQGDIVLREDLFTFKTKGIFRVTTEIIEPPLKGRVAYRVVASSSSFPRANLEMINIIGYR